MPLIPAVVLPSQAYPFVTGRNYLFRIMVELLFTGHLLLLLLGSKGKEKYTPKNSWISLSLILFFVVVGVANFFGENPERSFWSTLVRMGGYVTLMHLMAFFFSAATFLNKSQDWQKFFKISLIVSTFIALYGLAQYFGLYPINRGPNYFVDATFAISIYLGSYLAVHMFVLVWLALTASKKTNIFYGVLFLLHFIVFVASGSRGVFVGCLGGILVGLSLLVVKYKKKILSPRIFFGLLAFFVVAGIVDYNSKISIFNRFKLETITKNPRLISWAVSMEAFKDNPMLGVGQENYHIVFNKHFDPTLNHSKQWYDRPHNIVLDWIISAGIIGLMSYLLLYVAFFMTLKRTKLDIYNKTILIAMVAAYFLQNIFLFDHLVSYLFFFAILLYVHISSEPINVVSLFSLEKIQSKLSQIVNKLNLSKLYSPVSYFLAIIIVMGSMSIIYHYNIRELIVGQDYFYGALSPKTDIIKRLKFSKKYFNEEVIYTSETRRYFLKFVKRVSKVSKLPAKLKQEFYNLAMREMKKQLRKDPNNALTQVSMANFLLSHRKMFEALPYLIRALELSPTRPKILKNLGIVYLFKKQYQMAFKYLEKSYNLRKDLEVKKLYALAAALSGKKYVAYELLGKDYSKILANVKIRL